MIGGNGITVEVQAVNSLGIGEKALAFAKEFFGGELQEGDQLCVAPFEARPVFRVGTESGVLDRIVAWEAEVHVYLAKRVEEPTLDDQEADRLGRMAEVSAEVVRATVYEIASNCFYEARDSGQTMTIAATNTAQKTVRYLRSVGLL